MQNKGYDRRVKRAAQFCNQLLFESLTEEEDVNKCKDEVLGMIEAAMTANRARGLCNCRFGFEAAGLCGHCRVEKALKKAKACIIASVSRFDVIKVNMMSMQLEIEGKIKMLMEV